MLARRSNLDAKDDLLINNIKGTTLNDYFEGGKTIYVLIYMFLLKSTHINKIFSCR
jgi:hypothetical protein